MTHICQKAIFKHTPESAFPGTQRINEDRKGFQSGQQFRRTREQQAVSASPGSVFQEIITEGEAGRSLWNCQEYPKEEENPMNEQQLRYIHAIEREESIQKASSSLGKSPSTVARVVKNCENELGAVLFRRVGRKMILTPEEWADGCGCRQGGNPGKGHLWTEHEIRYLLCFREYQNISRAAQELYVAQPSLSQMLKELETDLGAEVFLRGKGGVEESFFGRELLNRLEEADEGRSGRAERGAFCYGVCPAEASAGGSRDGRYLSSRLLSEPLFWGGGACVLSAGPEPGGGLEACRGLPKGGENTEKFQGIFAASDRDAWADERFRFFVFYRTGFSLYDK